MVLVLRKAMNVKLKKCLLVAIYAMAVSLSGCANKPSPETQTMFTSYDDFRPGPKHGVDLYWAAPSINSRQSLNSTFEKYDSAIIDRVFVVVDESTKENLDEKEVKIVNDYLIEKIKTRLSKRFTITEKPTENTLRISIAVSNVETANPILATTSSVLPFGIGLSIISWVTTGEHTNTGNATMEILLSDAMTNKPIIAAIDRRSGNKDFRTIIDNTDDVKDAIDGWVDQIGKVVTP